MKNNSISDLGKLAMVIAAILLQFSCQQEESYGLSPDSTLMNLSVSAFNNGTAMVNDDPASVIKSLCILQFNANGNDFGTLRHVGVGRETALNSGKYSVTLLQSVDTNDKYKLVVVANLPGDDYSIFQRMGGKSYAEVQQLCLSQEYAGENNVPTFNAVTPFPMFGVVNNGNPMIITETVRPDPVSLVRAVARVDIGVGTKKPDSNTWTKGSVKFNMTQVQIWKAGKQYAYMPVANNFASVAGTLNINKPSVVGGVETKVYEGSAYITNATYCSEKIYLPEADLFWENGGGVYDANHKKRLAIIVGGYYNNSPDLSYYRVDFTNDVSGVKMNILRNYIYQFTIKSVTDKGYATAELAYNSMPKNLGFEATLEPWTTGQSASVPSISGYYLNYQGFNGENLDWTYAAGSSQTIPKKKSLWIGFNFSFDYNIFYDEGNSYYAPIKIPYGQNGKLYATVPDALNYEGIFPSLMVSGSDIVDESGNETVPWKTGTTLTAFDLCRDLEENGFDDWRLPRLSELAFIYVNQGSLEKLRGFTPLSGTYWCGSEYLEGTTDELREKSGSAWAVDFNTSTGYALHYKKTEKLRIRCVRQKSNDK